MRLSVPTIMGSTDPTRPVVSLLGVRGSVRICFTDQSSLIVKSVRVPLHLPLLSVFPPHKLRVVMFSLILVAQRLTLPTVCAPTTSVTWVLPSPLTASTSSGTTTVQTRSPSGVRSMAVSTQEAHGATHRNGLSGLGTQGSPQVPSRRPPQTRSL